MMEEEPIEKSRIPLFIYLYCLFFVCSFAFGIYLLNYSFRDKYLDFYPFLGGIIIILVALLIMGAVFLWPHIRIYSDRLEIVRIFGNASKKIYYKDINYWTEEYVYSRDGSFYLLIIYTKYGKYSLNSNAFKDYALVKKIITEGKPENIKEEVRRKAAGGKILIGISMLPLIAMLYFLNKQIVDIPANELTSITATLSNRPKIIESGKTGEVKDLYLWFYEYPEYTFRVPHSFFGGGKAIQLMNDLSVGDSVELDVFAKTAKTKLTHQLPLGFFDKTIDYRYVAVYGLRSKGQSYLSLNNLNSYRQLHHPKYNIIGILLGFLFIGFFVTGLQLIRKGY